jgi:predicted MFS family arabinose efflux permease
MRIFLSSIPDPDLRSNINHLCWDIFWYGVTAGSVTAFLSIYAARLGATGLQIGLLTAAPAIVSLIVSLPAGRWLERHSLIRVPFYGSIAQRAGYPVIMILPWLFPASSQIWALELTILLMSVPGALLMISFNSMFVQVIPPDQRAQVVGWRNALLAISVTVTSLLCGRLLDWIAFPLNYQIVFGLGTLGAALSTWHLGHIRAPKAPMQPGCRSPRNARSGGNPLLRFDLLRGPFGSLLAVYLLFYAVQYLPVPIFPLAYVREIRLSDGAISLGNAVFFVAMFLVSLRLGRVSGRLGHRRVLMLGVLLYAMQPLLVGLAQEATLFWVALAAGGGAWALASAGLTNRLMERVPPDDLPAHMALHNIVLNLGILMGSFTGPLFGNEFGLRPALLLSAGLWFVSGILLGLWS